MGRNAFVALAFGVALASPVAHAESGMSIDYWLQHTQLFGQPERAEVHVTTPESRRLGASMTPAPAEVAQLPAAGRMDFRTWLHQSQHAGQPATGATLPANERTTAHAPAPRPGAAPIGNGTNPELGQAFPSARRQGSDPLTGMPRFQTAAPSYLRSGFYVGGGGGYSFQNIAVENLTDGALLDENDFSYKVYVGYRFNSLLARELSYANLGRTRVHNTTNDTFRVNENSFRIGSDDDVDITTTSIGLAGLISTPIDGNLVGFAKLGAHIWTTSGSGSGDFTVTDDEEGGSTTNIDIFLGLGAD